MKQRTEEQSWLSEMENDALIMGAHDFAIKHKIYNLPVWERMQDGPKIASMLTMSIITLGQLKQFLESCLQDLTPEDVLGTDTGQWLNFTIQKIDTLLEAYPYPYENFQAVQQLGGKGWDVSPPSTHDERGLCDPDSVSSER